MQAMVLTACHDMDRTAAPLEAMDMPLPAAGPGELLVKVAVSGVCHTELNEIEGRTRPPRFPIIPGHQIVGTVAAMGFSGVFPLPVYQFHSVIPRRFTQMHFPPNTGIFHRFKPRDITKFVRLV